MSTGTIDFRTPAAGFDQPLALWIACHERVMRMCGLLQLLHEHIRDKGVNEPAGVTAHSVLRYFEEAAPRHHEDEEQDLFPRLLQRLTGDERDVVARTVDQLSAEHATLGAAWAALKVTLEAIERREELVLDRAAVDAFSDGYRRHIALEENALAPAMRQAFDAADWREIGKSMAARRGVNWDELESGG